MIAKSDLVILVVSATALAIGVYRWQVNTRPVPPVAAQAPVTSAPNVTASPTVRVLAELKADAGARRSVATSNLNQRQAVLSPTNVLGSPIASEGSATILTSAPETDSAPQPLYGSYRVQYRDSLFSIARRFGTDVQTLREINGISGSLINVDQEILYPQVSN